MLGHNPKLDKSRVRVVPDRRSAMYALLVDSEGEVLVGVGDITILGQIDPGLVADNATLLREASMVVVDGNLVSETFETVLSTCTGSGVPIFFEPTDIMHARNAADSKHHSAVTYTSPNLIEFYTMMGLTPPEKVKISS